MQLLQLCDALIVWLAFLLASFLRDPVVSLIGPYLNSTWIEFASDVPPLSELKWLLVILVPVTPLILENFRFYENVGRRRVRDQFRAIINTLVVVGVLTMIAVVFFKITSPSRFVLIGALFLMGTLLLFRALSVRSIARHASRSDYRREHVLLAGAPDDVARFREDLYPDGDSNSWNIVGEFDLANRSLSDFEQALSGNTVERVVFVAVHTDFEKVSQAAEMCELMGVEAWIKASFIRSNIARPVFDSINNEPMLVLRTTPELSWALVAKSIIDRVGALLIIIATLPLWVFAYIGIKIASPGAPVFFNQMRAGRYGKPFKMWKFRTMVPDAESKLKDLKKKNGNDMSGPVFKLEKDPRIFPFGQMLRKLSIDELPQLLNVLSGQMSLVGPRPLPVYEVNEFEKSQHRRRLSVKPGITCEWQAGGRSKITEFEDWVKMDLEYIDNWSLWLDFKILLKTVPAVLFAKGAK